MGGDYTTNYLNGKGVVKFNSGTPYISFAPTVIPTTGWSLSILINSKLLGNYSAGVIGTTGSYNMNNLTPGNNIFTIIDNSVFTTKTNREPTTNVFEVNKYYNIMITSNTGPSTAYDGNAWYVNGLMSGESKSSGDSKIGNLNRIVLNTYTTSSVGTSAYLGTYPEVAYWNRALTNSEVKSYYQANKTKWGALVA